jgi:hypothetical protein
MPGGSLGHPPQPARPCLGRGDLAVSNSAVIFVLAAGRPMRFGYVRLFSVAVPSQEGARRD